MIALSCIFLLLAAGCNAVMDTLLYHFDTSIFQRFDRQFCDPCISWYNKYVGGKVENGHIKWKIWRFSINKPDALTDLWHLSKFFMIAFICAAIACLIPYPLFAFIILGTSWNVVFSLFYDKILKR